jgi:1-phosphofructokinase
VLRGGVGVLKVSHEDLRHDQRLHATDRHGLISAMRQMASGADHVVVTCGKDPVLVSTDGQLLEVLPPSVEPRDTSGAGDSFTAAMAAALARGRDLTAALRLGAAAGAINVTRRGLASGGRDEIERLADHVEVRPLTA